MDLDRTQLASSAGTDVETVRRLIEVGLLPEADRFDDSLVPRVRFAVLSERSGIPLEMQARAVHEGMIALDSLDASFRGGARILDSTYAELAAELGLSGAFADAVQIALGVDASVDGSSVREDDAELMTTLARLVGLDVAEHVVLRLFQLMSDNLQRTVRAVNEMWKDGIHRPLLEAGASYRDLLGARASDSEQFRMLGEELVRLLWRRYLDEQVFRGSIETLECALAEEGMLVAGDRPPAIAFMDLTAFTHRTDQRGDELAATEVRGLVDVIRRRTVRWSGTLVKMLGDGAMLHFADPAAAVHCALALIDDIADAGMPPGRFGINAGPLIVRDVDYFGATVNVAARLVDYARPGEVLVGASVVSAVDDPGIRFEEIGPVSLKGVTTLVTVHAARPANDG